jgi:hypothetical protein
MLNKTQTHDTLQTQAGVLTFLRPSHAAGVAARATRPEAGT